MMNSIESEYKFEFSNFEEVKENIIDIIFQERTNVLHILKKFENAYKNEKLYTELYVTMTHDYYYKKMPTVFYNIAEELVEKSKNNTRLRTLIEILLDETNIAVQYFVNV